MTTQLQSNYAQLGDVFCQRIAPTPCADPRLLVWNAALAEELGLSDWLPSGDTGLAQCFGGNELLKGSQPVATAYAGHQFGHFVPQLGDGRAHLLGEWLDSNGCLWEIQLKGSGPSRYSRAGDGRCALGPALREYLMSEAMAALGVPTGRCLAVVTTGENVQRQISQPGAVVTRVGRSHLRVGSLQYFAARRDHESLAALVTLAVARHYPDLDQNHPLVALDFLESLMEKQAYLVAQWLRVGFIHGVLNTDNCSLGGDTIDYGPCAMLGHYDPSTVYSSIDRRGRYAYDQQPSITFWNLIRVAECLVPLVHEDSEQAAALLEEKLHLWEGIWKRHESTMRAAKLGFNFSLTSDVPPAVNQLGDEWLEFLKHHGLDYTNEHIKLSGFLLQSEQIDPTMADWFERWRSELQLHWQSEQFLPKAVEQLSRQNPQVIPRNHHVEALLHQAILQPQQLPTLWEQMLTALQRPYEITPFTTLFQDPPVDGDKGYQTFCGT